jgi:hypothetical protein
MKNQRQKLTAIKGILFAALLAFGGAAWAQVVGVVAHLSGPLIAKKANGAVKVLAAKSEVENGDTLVSEKNTYAQIKFIDHGEITLRPNTTFKIENFAYDAGKPENDAAKFDLVKGGLRSITGLLGKRNKEKFEMKTPSATIGIRGTTFVATYVPPSGQGGIPISYDVSPISGAASGKQPNTGTGTGVINRSPDGGDPSLTVTGGKQPAATGRATDSLPTPGAGSSTTTPPGGQGTSQQAPGMAAQLAALLNGGNSVPPAPPGSGGTGLQNGPGTNGPVGPPVLPPGLHLQVTDGAIIVTNSGGSQGFQAGQFGFVPNVNQPPVIVPSNPGIQFAPPPSFNSGSGGPTASNGPGQGQATDCIVR